MPMVTGHKLFALMNMWNFQRQLLAMQLLLQYILKTMDVVCKFGKTSSSHLLFLDTEKEKDRLSETTEWQLMP